MSARCLGCGGPVYQLTPVRDGAVVDGEQVIGCLTCNQASGTAPEGNTDTHRTDVVGAVGGGTDGEVGDRRGDPEVGSPASLTAARRAHDERVAADTRAYQANLTREAQP